MKKQMASLAVIGAIGIATLSACGSKTDANETNFRSAVDKYYEKHGELCIRLRDWPVKLVGDLESYNSQFVQDIKALEAAGLIKAEESVEGSNKKSVSYDLTDMARQYIKNTTSTGRVDLCWGKKRVDKVVKWIGPRVSGDYQEALVIHTYKVVDIVDWAKRPDMQAAFPTIKEAIDEAGKEEVGHPVVLTSVGWESVRLNRH